MYYLLVLTTSLQIPNLGNTLSDTFDGTNVILTNFWPVLVYFLAIGVGFWILAKIIGLFGG